MADQTRELLRAALAEVPRALESEDPLIRRAAAAVAKAGRVMQRVDQQQARLQRQRDKLTAKLTANGAGPHRTRRDE
jgi:hypothetical protein